MKLKINDYVMFTASKKEVSEFRFLFEVPKNTILQILSLDKRAWITYAPSPSLSAIQKKEWISARKRRNIYLQTARVIVMSQHNKGNIYNYPTRFLRKIDSALAEQIKQDSILQKILQLHTRQLFFIENKDQLPTWCHTEQKLVELNNKSYV